ncbi:hypothetical protein MPLB_1810027 [Mesorhizobium sp. ORS 3324]|nr:hypothetical protein MPLB_1810027 [Mesorhizobium sp. ORS 3324]
MGDGGTLSLAGAAEGQDVCAEGGMGLAHCGIVAGLGHLGPVALGHGEPGLLELRHRLHRLHCSVRIECRQCRQIAEGIG